MGRFPREREKSADGGGTPPKGDHGIAQVATRFLAEAGLAHRLRDLSSGEVEGVDPDYARAARRYLGESQAGPYLADIEQPGTRMARISVRPDWVGVLDFQNRLASPLGGIQPS